MLNEPMMTLCVNKMYYITLPTQIYVTIDMLRDCNNIFGTGCTDCDLDFSARVMVMLLIVTGKPVDTGDCTGRLEVSRKRALKRALRKHMPTDATCCV